MAAYRYEVEPIMLVYGSAQVGRTAAAVLILPTKSNRRKRPAVFESRVQWEGACCVARRKSKSHELREKQHLGLWCVSLQDGYCPRQRPFTQWPRAMPGSTVRMRTYENSRGGIRTRTPVTGHGILSPERLPVPPLGRPTTK